MTRKAMSAGNEGEHLKSMLFRLAMVIAMVENSVPKELWGLTKVGDISSVDANYGTMTPYEMGFASHLADRQAWEQTKSYLTKNYQSMKKGEWEIAH